MHQRYAWFFVIAVMSQAFSGILAYGFSQMGGLSGVRGWRWSVACFLLLLVPQTDIGKDLHHGRYTDLRHRTSDLRGPGRLP
jgi:hypothetical protein